MNQFDCINITKTMNNQDTITYSIRNLFDKIMMLYHLLDSDYSLNYNKDKDEYIIVYNNALDANRVYSFINGMHFISYGSMYIINAIIDNNTIILDIVNEKE